MESVTIFVREIVKQAGVTGANVPLVTHIAMVLMTFAIAILGYYLCRRLLVPVALKLTEKTSVKWDDKVLNSKVLVSLCHIVPAIIIWRLLPDIFYKYAWAEEILKRLTAIYITVMSVRSAIVLVDSVKTLENPRHASLQQYFHSFCGIFKIAVIFVAVIVIVSIIIGSSPLTLFAGLGATSAVLMLVFKDTIEGFMAGIRLTSNDMIHRGDWITVPGTEANGTVMDMTLSTVKIRNFDNTIVTVSPQTLINGSFQNWIGMQQSDGRRVTRKIFYDFNSISLVGDDMKAKLAEQGFLTMDEMQGEHVNLSLYCRYLEKYISSLPVVNTRWSVLVHQLEPTTQGLPVEFYFFLYEKDWLKHERQLSDIMNHIYAVTPCFGLRIFQLSEKTAEKR